MEEPERIQRLLHFKGFPVPWMMMLFNGLPDFRTLDAERVLRCAQERRCGICGETLGVRVCFVGGVKSCASAQFVDPPFHRECALYSFEICPYLFGRVNYSKAIPKPGTINLEVGESDKMGVYCTKSYSIVKYQGSYLFIAGVADEIIWRERRRIS